MRHLFLLEWCFVPNRPAAAASMMGIGAVREALREENRILEVQNELIKLFLALPPSRGEAGTDDSQSDLADAVAPRLRHPKTKTKRTRPRRKPTTPTPCSYEMDSKTAFEKYDFSLPETARDALLLMTCVPERDLRRAARLRLMAILFPRRIDERVAVHEGTPHGILDPRRARVFRRRPSDRPRIFGMWGDGR